MKKLFAIALALVLMLCAVSAFAAVQNVDQQANKNTPATKVVNIVPGISVDDPGRIKLAISAENPTLIFEKAGETGSEYYQLKMEGSNTSVDVDFLLTNTSVAGSGTDPFNGKLKVKADCALAKEGGGKTHANINVDMSVASGVEKTITNDAQDKANENKDFKLQYTNNADAGTKITDEPTVDNIQGNLSVNVTFTITPLTGNAAT